MKVLYVAPNFPNDGQNAADTRLRQILPRLEKMVDLKVLGFSSNMTTAVNDSVSNTVLVKKPPFSTAKTLATTFSSWPNAFHRFSGVEAQEIFQETEKDFRPDIVHYDTFGCIGLSRYSTCPRSVFHVHDAISKKFSGWRKSEKNWLKKMFLLQQEQKVRYAEKKLFPGSSTCIVDSQEDADLLTRETGASVNVVALGYDEQTYAPNGPRIKLAEKSIVFSGSMASLQSLDAVRWLYQEILPIVWKQIPDAQVYIVGSKPLPEIKAIGQKDQRLHITGFVDDLSAYLRSASLVACPLRIGSGMKTRVIEALATGCPMVSTAQGVAGLQRTKELAWIESDEAAGFAQGIIRLLENKEERDHLGQQAANYTHARYTWTNTANQIHHIYTELMNS